MQRGFRTHVGRTCEKGHREREKKQDCVWHVPEKKEGACVKIVTVGRRVPEGGQGSDDALVWCVSFCSRKLLTTFCLPYYQVKLVLAQKNERKSPLPAGSYSTFVFSMGCCEGAQGYIFCCWRTAWQDTWLLDEFIPALEAIKLLTLYSLSNH